MKPTDGDLCWIGFDLGGTKMLATVYDSSFQPLALKRKKTRGYEGAKAGLSRIKDMVHEVREAAGIEIDQVGGIGLGCPGPLDLDEGIIFDAPNLGWKNVKVSKALEKEFGIPTIVLNDVDAGVYGESRFGAAKSARCTLGVFPGTGVGGGCVYDGRIVRGRHSSCMEIGHVCVSLNGPRCGCGLSGCLEAVASRLAVSAAAAQAAYRGQAPQLRKMIGTDIAEIRSGVLASAIKAGDDVVEQIVRRAACFIGVAVAGVVHLLAPDCVVLGGGMVEAMPDLIVPQVKESAQEHVLPSFVDSFEVVAAKLGDDASVMGAAAWAREVVSSRLEALPE